MIMANGSEFICKFMREKSMSVSIVMVIHLKMSISLLKFSFALNSTPLRLIRVSLADPKSLGLGGFFGPEFVVRPFFWILDDLWTT